MYIKQKNNTRRIVTVVMQRSNQGHNAECAIALEKCDRMSVKTLIKKWIEVFGDKIMIDFISYS